MNTDPAATPETDAEDPTEEPTTYAKEQVTESQDSLADASTELAWGEDD